MEINKIKVGNRFRKDIGDLEELKNSIKELGLLQPIVIDENNNLIAGQRRLLACKELGMEEILVNVVNIDNAVRGEYDENVIRKNFSPSESVSIWQAMESHQGLRGESPRSEQRREKAAKATGIGTKKLQQAKQVVESGDKNLIKQMDKTGNVDKAYKQVKKEQTRKIQIDKGKQAKIIPVKLYNDDFKNVDIKENSIDVILTDPPYPKEYLYLWDDLAKYANKVLKPSGFLIAYSGHLYMQEVMQALSNELKYYWTFCLYHKGLTQIVNARNLIVRWKPIFIFQKTPFKKYKTIDDYIISEKSEKDGHDWQQSESGAVKTYKGN